jgi:uncharacterized protein HemX
MIYNKKQSGFSFLTNLLIVAAIGLGFIGYAAYQKYEQKQAKAKQILEINEARTKFKATMVKYQDAMQLAASTSRIALAGPVATLQTLKREADLVAVPACMKNSKDFLMQGMNTSIDHFLDFMRQKSTEAEQTESAANIKAHFENAAKAQDICNEFLQVL